MKKKCQCPYKGNAPPWPESLYSEEEKVGMNHKPNECKCTNDIRLYQRGNRKLYLCSRCHLPGDMEIKAEKE
jgi:predicted SprT family Zn-dependent metalloprotease